MPTVKILKFQPMPSYMVALVRRLSGLATSPTATTFPVPSFHYNKIHKPCHLSYLDLLSASPKPHRRPSFSFKCLAPDDLQTGRPECKDADHLAHIYTRSDHLEGLQTYDSSQSSPPAQTLSPSANLPPTSLDLHRHNMYGIIHHLLALLNSSWPHLIR